MSAQLLWLIGLFVIQAIAVAAAISWASRRIRVNRPVTRRQQITIMVPLVALLIATWIVSFITSGR